MSGYGFGKKPAARAQEQQAEAPLDLSGIERRPLVVDPAREEAAMRRGDALGFVDRSADRALTHGGPDHAEGAGQGSAGAERSRRRRAAQPQISVYIKGPRDTLDWFVEYTNQRGYRSYWQALEEFRAAVEGRGDDRDEDSRRDSGQTD